MKIYIRSLALLILFLTIGLNAQAQNSQPSEEGYQLAKERAVRLANKLAEAITAQEPKWKLKDGFEGSSGYPAEGPRHLEFVKQQFWKAGKYSAEIRIYVCESVEQASIKQKQHSFWSSVSASRPLDGVGDEAYYINYPYFTWISVRKGSIVVAVNGPGGLTYARGFINLALPLMNE